MVSRVFSCANVGLDCELVEVEADYSAKQLPGFAVVGLTDTAIQEAKERVRLAIENSNLPFPRGKVTVNLAPADLRKEGPKYDMSMAISIVQSQEMIPYNLSDCLFVGELALNGETRHTTGILPAAVFAKKHGFKKFFIPEKNFNEAALIEGIEIYPVKNLSELFLHLIGERFITIPEALPLVDSNLEIDYEIDMAHVEGQEQAKRALEIAAAGGHNALMSGPPGSGKTLLAKALASILPKMTQDEILEVSKIYSIAGLLKHDDPAILKRPFRSPHHTSSGISLVGGGKIPRPGEISLAHRGVLFLDEFPEFPRQVLENLRQPLEDGQISISRAQGTLKFPTQFILIASQNPCPCGYYGDTEKKCLCTSIQILKYQKKISGPIIDRIDLHVDVPRLNFDKMQSNSNNESSRSIRLRIESAREKQIERFKNLSIKNNAEMKPPQIKEFCKLDNKSTDLLRNAVNQYHLSGRSFHRLLKVARTIADLDNYENIEMKHLAEALQYRAKQQ